MGLGDIVKALRRKWRDDPDEDLNEDAANAGMTAHDLAVRRGLIRPDDPRGSSDPGNRMNMNNPYLPQALRGDPSENAEMMEYLANRQQLKVPVPVANPYNIPPHLLGTRDMESIEEWRMRMGKNAPRP